MDAQQRSEIISLARKTIVQQGVKALRMDDIAHAARVSKRTLYETFGDKEELLFLAAREHFDFFDRNNLKASEAAPNVLIAMLIIMEEIRKNANVNWQIRNTIKRFHPKISERLWDHKADHKRKIVVDAIRLGIKEGYIESRINIEFTMSVFTYIATAITEQNEMINIPSGMSIEVAFNEVITNYMRGISTQKGVEAIDEYLKQKEENNIN